MPITFLDKMRTWTHLQGRRWYRWFASLSVYGLSVTYRSGEINVDADALSRLHEGNSDLVNSNVSIKPISHYKKVCNGLLVDWYPAYACYLHQHVVSENQIKEQSVMKQISL